MVFLTAALTWNGTITAAAHTEQVGLKEEILVGQQIQSYLAPEDWLALTADLERGKPICQRRHYFQVPIGLTEQFVDWEVVTHGGQRTITAIVRSIKLVQSEVSEITDTADNDTDKGASIGQNNRNASVSTIRVPMLFDTDETQAFIKAAYEVAGDFLEPNYRIMPRLTYSLDRDVVFICKPPFAYNAGEAFDRLSRLKGFRFIHFHLFCRNENKKRLSPALLAYGDRALSDRLSLESLRKSTLIMSNQIQTDAAPSRKWAGMANYLQDPKAVRYWNYLLDDRPGIGKPLVASAYIYSADDRNEIVAVGAKRTFDQLNRKTNSGAPAILHQSVHAFDDQIRHYRMQAIAEVVEHGRTDIPAIVQRNYYDSEIGLDFAFTEEVFLLSTGEKLNICCYQTEDLDRYWAKKVEAERKYRS